MPVIDLRRADAAPPEAEPRFHDLDPAATTRLPEAVAIRIRFGGFADGRGLTLARQLRAAGFAGRLRAAGALLPDQRAALRGCGFDEVELEPAHMARTGGAAQWTAPAAPPPFAARRAAQA